ncbi:MAG: hypothetical protein AB9919_12405 [Geobacteraceae bacterium]
MIRSGALTEDIIKKIVNSFVDSSINNFELRMNNEAITNNPEDQKEIDREKERLKKALSSKKRRNSYTLLNNCIINEFRKDLALRNGKEQDYIIEYVDKCIDKLGLDVDKSSPEYNRLCNEMLKGTIKILTVINEHELGNYDTDYDKELSSKKKFINFKELIELYEKDKNDSWSDPSRLKSTHRQLLHIIGEVPIDKINREVTINLIQALKTYPKKLSQKDMLIPWIELSKLKKDKLSDSSQHYIKTAFATLIKYAKDNDLGIKGNPAKGIADKKPKNTNACKPYSTEELQSLIDVLKDVDRDKAPEMFWIPLLLLYTGARSNEICMLRCEDIELCGDIWVIKFLNRPEHFQRTKNHEDRQAPIHDAIINLGFIDYVVNQKSTGNERLFQNLKLYRDKWNTQLSQLAKTCNIL